MLKISVALASIFALASAGTAQEKVMPAQVPPPTIGIARAIKNEGKIELVLTRMVSVPVRRTEVVEINGKKVERAVVAYVPQTQEFARTVDGKQVTVTRKDGKKIEPADLPTLLERPTAVVLFEFGVRDNRYLQILREDALVVTFQMEPVVMPLPPKQQ